MTAAIKTLTVVGAGFMGIQIAVRAAQHGYPVRIYDIKPEAVEAVQKAIQDNIGLLNLLGKLTEKPETILGRFSYYTDLAAAVKDADLVCEQGCAPRVNQAVYVLTAVLPRMACRN